MMKMKSGIQQLVYTTTIQSLTQNDNSLQTFSVENGDSDE